jgi:hypothetical protein
MFADPPVTRLKTKVKIVEKEKADKTAAVKP